MRLSVSFPTTHHHQVSLLINQSTSPHVSLACAANMHSMTLLIDQWYYTLTLLRANLHSTSISLLEKRNQENQRHAGNFKTRMRLCCHFGAQNAASQLLDESWQFLVSQIVCVRIRAALRWRADASCMRGWRAEGVCHDATMVLPD